MCEIMGLICASFPGDDCVVADLIFSINSEGKIQRLSEAAQDKKGETGLKHLVSVHCNDSETLGEKEETTPTSPPAAIVPVLEKTADDEDEVMRKGDHKLYFYYLGSVTRTFIVILFVSTALASLSERLPGKAVARYLGQLLTQLQQYLSVYGEQRIRTTTSTLLALVG